MSGRTEAFRGWGAARAAALFVLTVLPAKRLPAQAVLSQFSYDNLRPSALQIDIGMLGSTDLTGAVVGGARLDYGFVAPKVRVLLGLSYFRSEFDNEARSRFEDRIRQFVIDPSGDDMIRVGSIYWSDLIADLDLQYVLPQGAGVWAYVGLGFGAHLRNGSGALIDDTFVEDALDGISAALNATVGVDIALGSALRVTFDGRGVLSPDLSTVSLRTGLAYRFADRRPSTGGAR